MKLIHIRLSQTLGMVLVFSLSVLSATAAEEQMAAVIDPESAVLDNTPETYSNDNWLAPSTVEFNKLDKSGNGLLLPNEASKGKAFNKKTFKQADTDSDGSIDLNEYVFFKTGKMPESAKPAMTSAPPAGVMPDKPAAVDEPVMEGTP